MQGGHGTNKAKAEYEMILKREYNVEIVWQIPNSLETNMLDLGTWMAVQSVVERNHRLKVMQPDVLAETIQKTFQSIQEQTKLNIHERWLKVLKLIVKRQGSNQLVEKCRRKKDIVDKLVYVDEGKIGNLFAMDDDTSNDEFDMEEQDHNDDDWTLL